MKDLIERLEKATGPDTWLDCNIREAVEGWKNIGGGWREWPDGRRELYDYGRASPYTASIDAALTLVPEGWDWRVSGIDWCNSKRDQYFASIREYNEPNHPKRDAEGFARAPTPALALCIAALKARASLPSTKEEENGG